MAGGLGDYASGLFMRSVFLIVATVKVYGINILRSFRYVWMPPILTIGEKQWIHQWQIFWRRVAYSLELAIRTLECDLPRVGRLSSDRDDCSDFVNSGPIVSARVLAMLSGINNA